LGELDRIGVFADGPLAGVGNLVGIELLKRLLFRFPDYAHADLDKRSAGLRFRISQAHAVGEKLLHRSGDRVV